MTNNAKIGGVLSIVAGAFGLLYLLFFIGIAVVMLVMRSGFGSEFDFNGARPDGMFAAFAAFYVIIGIGYAIIGALAIVGGVFALRKKQWGWALAGAIAGTVVFMPCGIPAIIYVAMGRPEFQAGAAPAAAPTAPTIG